MLICCSPDQINSDENIERQTCRSIAVDFVLFNLLQSGEKTALAIAILVSQTLYFTLVIEVRTLSLRWEYYDCASIWGENIMIEVRSWQMCICMCMWPLENTYIYTVTSISKWSIISHPRLSRPPPSPCPCLAATSSSPWWASPPTSLTSHTNWSSRNNDGVHPQPLKKTFRLCWLQFWNPNSWYFNPCRCWWLYQCVLPP